MVVGSAMSYSSGSLRKESSGVTRLLRLLRITSLLRTGADAHCRELRCPAGKTIKISLTMFTPRYHSTTTLISRVLTRIVSELFALTFAISVQSNSQIKVGTCVGVYM